MSNGRTLAIYIFNIKLAILSTNFNYNDISKYIFIYIHKKDKNPVYLFCIIFQWGVKHTLVNELLPFEATTNVKVKKKNLKYGQTNLNVDERNMLCSYVVLAHNCPRLWKLVRNPVTLWMCLLHFRSLHFACCHLSVYHICSLFIILHIW